MLKGLVVLGAFASGAAAQAVNVRVPGTAQIVLAGADAFDWGPMFPTGSDSNPANLPTKVDLILQAGQAIQITATGEVNLDTRSANRLSVSGPAGLTEPFLLDISLLVQGIQARRGALVGVFKSDDRATGVRRRIVNYMSAAEQIEILEPVLSVPFLIGDGKAPSGALRTFIVPRGATRLFLGIQDGPVSDNSGEYLATVNVVPRPPTGITNPLRLLGTSSGRLAGEPEGVILGLTVSTATPLNTPAVVNVSALGPSVRRVRIGAVGSIDVDRSTAGIGPEGRFTTIESFSANFTTGTSGIRAPNGALIGIFLGDQVNPDARVNFVSDFGTQAARDATPLTPQLQQFFYIGNGRTAAGTLKEIEIPTAATRLLLGIHDEGLNRAADNYGQFFVVVNPVSDAVPSYSATQVVNGASFQSGSVAAGAIISVLGQRLASGADQASTVPLPVSLGGTRVWFNDFEAPLFFVSPEQINAQIPYELGSASTVQVVVSNGGPPGAPQLVPIVPVKPGIFVYGTNKPVIVNATTGQLVAESGSVPRGTALVIYATGLGAAKGAPAPGYPASLTDLSPVNAEVRVVIGGVSVTPFFAGLAPGFVGVNQVNVIIPANVATGSTTLYLVSGGVESNRVLVEISN